MVALQPYEVDHHRERLAAASAIFGLDAVSEVGEELVAALQHTQANERLVPEVVEDLSGQCLGPKMTSWTTKAKKVNNTIHSRLINVKSVNSIREFYLSKIKP